MSETERDDLRRHDEDTGVTLRIIYDGDADSPVADDESVLFAVYHRHRTNRQGHLPTAESAMEFAEANAGEDSEWAVFGLFAYEHGNIMFRPSKAGNPFNDPFDSAQAGIIALKRATFEGDLFKIAEGICESYSDWCNGEVYGYVVDDPVNGSDDSCWGYIGDPEDDGAYTEGLAAYQDAVDKARDTLAKRAAEEAAQAEADATAAKTRADALAELIAAARPFAEPNDTSASQRLKEALEDFEALT